MSASGAMMDDLNPRSDVPSHHSVIVKGVGGDAGSKSDVNHLFCFNGLW